MQGFEHVSVESAVNALIRGYEEERDLYLVVRNLTVSQNVSLAERRGLDRFRDFFDEKEDVLELIDEIEAQLAPAKEVVMQRHARHCPNGWKLNHLLSHLARIIEDIRALESQNASLLRKQPKAG